MEKQLQDMKIIPRIDRLPKESAFDVERVAYTEGEMLMSTPDRRIHNVYWRDAKRKGKVWLWNGIRKQQNWWWGGGVVNYATARRNVGPLDGLRSIVA